MKRFLPLILATGVLLLSGCHTADVPEAVLPEAGHGSTETGTVGGHEGEIHAGTYPSAPAFPASTPPSGKESVTALGYWGPRKVNTEPGGHANTAHGEAGGHGEEAGESAGH